MNIVNQIALCEAMYRGWSFRYDPKPVPSRSMDFDFIHDDYDGENKLFGNASDLIDALRQIEELEND